MNLSIHMVYLEFTPDGWLPRRLALASREGETLEQLAERLRLDPGAHLEIRAVKP